MKKTTKNLLIGSGIAAGITALGALHRSSARRLMEIALDREEPPAISRSRERLRGSKRLAEISEKLNAGAAWLESCGCEPITITGQDGTRLIGHWYCPAKPQRAIVAMHGWRSSWSQDFGLIAPFWHQNNCAVLYAEQRGQGESGGDHMGFGLLERYDCLDWIRWLHRRTEGKLPLYLGGVSMGAATILMTAGFDLPESVRGIVADCGFTSPHAIWKHVLEHNLHLPYGLYSATARQMLQRKLREEAYSCTEALRNCRVPVLFVHGTDDHFVPVEMTYENYKACAAPKRLFIVPGAEHGMSYLVDQQGYEEAVLKFWQENDQKNG